MNDNNPHPEQPTPLDRISSILRTLSRIDKTMDLSTVI